MRQQVIYNEKVAHLGSSSNILFRTFIRTTLSPTFLGYPCFIPHYLVMHMEKQTLTTYCLGT